MCCLKIWCNNSGYFSTKSITKHKELVRKRIKECKYRPRIKKIKQVRFHLERTCFRDTCKQVALVSNVVNWVAILSNLKEIWVKCWQFYCFFWIMRCPPDLDVVVLCHSTGVSTKRKLFLLVGVGIGVRDWYSKAGLWASTNQTEPGLHRFWP